MLISSQFQSKLSQKRGTPTKKLPSNKDQHPKFVKGKHMGELESEGLHGHSGDSELEHSGESDDHRHINHHPIRHPRHDSEASDSELEGSESSDEELEEGEVAHSRHCHQQLIHARRRVMAKYHHQQHHHPHHHETSEEEEEEEEDEDSEYLDSEDEELLKEAKLVNMKHACQQHDSEGSSDFEDEARLAHNGKMSYQMAQRILRKHHLQQQRILHQAHQLALQSQHKVRRRVQHKEHGQRLAKPAGDRPEAAAEGKGEEKEVGREHIKQEDLANTSLVSFILGVVLC